MQSQFVLKLSGYETKNGIGGSHSKTNSNIIFGSH